MKAECPLLKKKGKKNRAKRALVAVTWSEDEESGFEKDVKTQEVANLCLMRHEKENEVSTSNSSQFTFNELKDAFDDFIF